MKPALLLVCGACLIWLTLTRNNAWKTEITLWEDVARRHPGNIRAWANLSAYYRGAGQMERAMQALRNALSLYPEPGNFVSLGDLMAESERPGEALGAYKEAVVRAERDPLSEEDSRIVKKRAYFGMGNLAVREGDFKKAEGYFRRALEADGLFEPAWNNLGYSLLRQNRCAEAAEALRKALYLDPGDSVARENLDAAVRCRK